VPQADVVLAGRYRLRDRIAGGGMGEVWRGIDLTLRRMVAVKLLRAEYADHPEALARFRAEAWHAAGLSHPAIAQVYDYREPGPGQPPFLVMELVDGPPLSRVLASGPLDAARVLHVVAQAAAGLAAAHAAGLVHRDIKPANLLIGPGGAVKITDFGIAHAAGAAPLTWSGSLIGTPAYLAPERIAGAASGPPGDLYSLGIVAWEALAGHPPFTGTPAEIAAAHQFRPLPPLPAAVPPAVAALVGELTAKDPARRPAGAAVVAARAAKLRDALGITAPPSGTGQAALGPHRADPATLPLAVPAAAGAPDGMLPRRPATAWAARAGWRPRRRLTSQGMAGRLLPLAVAAVVAGGLAGWLLASSTGAAGTAGAGRHPAGRPAASTARTVEVSAAALIGQPAGAVARYLRALGLRVELAWSPSGRLIPGTVLAVQPSGTVPGHALILVTAASPPPGHARHRHGDGQGDGQGGDGGG
jgi:hypothetical protein